MKAKNTAFTLVEILIVVIILGILAAIVIPQFSEASNEARLASLQSDLQTVRSQIELYKIQHLDNTPEDDNPGNFWTQLTTKTNVDGTAGGDLGPYIMKAPTNAFVDSFAIYIGDPDDAAATDGWAFDTATGTFYAVGTGPEGEDLSTY